MTRKSSKKNGHDMKFWLIHASHWVVAFVFIFTALALAYVFFANDPVVASTFK